MKKQEYQFKTPTLYKVNGFYVIANSSQNASKKFIANRTNDALIIIDSIEYVGSVIL